MRYATASEARLMRENYRLKQRAEELEAKLEYVAMMTDVELYEEEEEVAEDVQENSEMVQ